MGKLTNVTLLLHANPRKCWYLHGFVRINAVFILNKGIFFLMLYFS